MVTYVYDLATGKFLYGGYCEPSYDPATQGVVKLKDHPNPKLERYDGKSETKTRPVTSEELAEEEAARKEAMAGERADDAAMMALGAFCLKELNTIRAALPTPLPPLQSSDLRAFVVNFVKARM